MCHWLMNTWIPHSTEDGESYKGHSRVMCVSSPVDPVIIINVGGARRMLPDRKAKDQPGVRIRSSGGKKDKDNNYDQGGDIPT